MSLVNRQGLICHKTQTTIEPIRPSKTRRGSTELSAVFIFKTNQKDLTKIQSPLTRCLNEVAEEEKTKLKEKRFILIACSSVRLLNKSLDVSNQPTVMCCYKGPRLTLFAENKINAYVLWQENNRRVERWPCLTARYYWTVF